LYSPHSPCGRGSHVKGYGNLAVQCGARLTSMGFCGICSHAPLVRYSTIPLTTPFALSALWRRPGRGAWPRKADEQHQRSGASFAVEWSGRKRGPTSPCSAPRFRRCNGTAKIRAVKGVRVKPALDSSDRRSSLSFGQVDVTILGFPPVRKTA